MTVVPVGLRSADRDGTDLRWLGRLGPVVGCKWTDTYPGGPAALTATLEVDPRSKPVALTPGRRLTVAVGAEAPWAGVVDRAEPGSNGWTIYGQGLAATANDFQVRQTGQPISSLVGDAVGRGLRWQPPTTLAADLAGPATLPGTVADALNGLTGRGLQWHVTADGQLSVLPPPTSPTLLVWATTPPGGRSRADSPTILVGSYTDLTGAAQTVVWVSPRAADPVEVPVDLTSLGQISATTATAVLASHWQAVWASTPWTAPVTVGQGQVTTMGGGLVDVRLLTAGVCVRMALIDPATEIVDERPDIVVGQVDVDVDAGTAALTPLQSARTDLLTLLARR